MSLQIECVSVQNVDEVNSEARNDEIHFSFEEHIFLKHCLQTYLKCWICLHSMYVEYRENRWYSLGVHHSVFFLDHFFSAEFLFAKSIHCPEIQKAGIRFYADQLLEGHLSQTFMS